MMIRSSVDNTAAEILAEISKEDASNVLWVFDRHDGYRQPGSFTEALIRAAMRADPGNLQKIIQVFPGVGSAVHVYKDVEGGRDWLVEHAEDGV